MPWHFLVVVLTVAVLAGGVLKGIEKVNAIMMPSFFYPVCDHCGPGLFFLPGALAGYEYLLVPRWEYLLKPETWVMAMGQAFFSLSITGSGMVIYGSYLDKKEDIPKAAVTTALLDTVAALLAGFAIIPAVFAFQMDPASGPPLMFITVPKVFSMIPAGRWVAVLFFLSVLFAGVTSLVNMLEVCSEAVQTHLHFSRKKAIFFGRGSGVYSRTLHRIRALYGILYGSDYNIRSSIWRRFMLYYDLLGLKRRKDHGRIKQGKEEAFRGGLSFYCKIHLCFSCCVSVRT